MQCHLTHLSRSFLEHWDFDINLINVINYTVIFFIFSFSSFISLGHAAGGAVGWGTALQAIRPRVLFPMVSLEFFIDIILPAVLWHLGFTQPVTEMSTRNISWGVKAAGA